MQPLSSTLTHWGQNQLTGRLDVEASNQSWSFYFSLGHLAWGKGGLHPRRCWQRLLAQHCPQLSEVEIGAFQMAAQTAREYSQLMQWHRDQTVTIAQVTTLMREFLAEMVFDSLQQEQSQTLTTVNDHQEPVNASLGLCKTSQILETAQQRWQAWSNAGLMAFSPNLAPVIRQPELLQSSVPAPVYATLTQVIDGDKTLREIATLIQKNPVILTQSLIPYIRKGWMELVTIADRPAAAIAQVPQPEPIPTINNASPPTSSLPKLSPLVACVEDGAVSRLLVEDIVKSQGYRFVGIEDSMRAVPTLLRHKPDLIFLDLMMPGINGYEVCSQIRKISALKDTPVVILTGNDGVVDQVRARMVGATDFLSKPIREDQIVGALRKFLPPPTRGVR
jgi:chemotaxis family two-component system response regulator PixG